MKLRIAAGIAGAAILAGTVVGGLDVLGLDDDYDRRYFGPRWADVDGNGCDTRNDVLRRDLIDPVLQPGSSCVVVAGTLVDPYTGERLRFRAGDGTVHVDHIYSLAEAWEDGAKHWSADERLRFANDLENLLATKASTNLSKGSRSPDEWKPPDPGLRCPYAVQYALVAFQYELKPDLGEQLALNTMCQRR